MWNIWSIIGRIDFPEKARTLVKFVILYNLFFQRRNVWSTELQCDDTFPCALLENLLFIFLIKYLPYHILKWQKYCKIVNLYALLMIEKHLQAIQMNIQLMFRKFLPFGIMDSKNLRNENDCFLLFSRSYHSHVDFFQLLQSFAHRWILPNFYVE